MLKADGAGSKTSSIVLSQAETSRIIEGTEESCLAGSNPAKSETNL